MTNKKFLVLSLVILFILLIGLFIYREPIQNQLTASRDRIKITQTLEDFYKDYIRAINTNENWIELAEKYTAGRAKDLIVKRAVVFLDDASQGKQHLADIISPITIRFYDLDSSRAKALVDFELKQRIVGMNPNPYAIEKLLVLEKIDNKWMIIEDLDRSDRFNEWVREQNFLTVRTSYY